jgi:hypothetical protein
MEMKPGLERSGVTMLQSALRGTKCYLLVRWKKRWPIVPVVPFFVISWAVTADPYKVHQQLHRVVIGAVIWTAFVIVFPFRWGLEDWEEPNK